MTSAQIAIMTTIILYLCLVIFTGVMIGKRSKKSAEGFYLGGRGMGPLVTAMSAEASDMSSYLLMGIPGLAYLSGVADASWTAIGLAIGTYLNFLLVARRLRRYSVELDAITIPSFISKRYGEKKPVIMGISAVIILVFFVPYVASGLAAIGKLFNSLFGWNYMLSVIVGAIVIISYTSVGGFSAVATMDLIQSVIMTVALCVIVVFGIVQAGGMDAVLAHASSLPGFLSFGQTYNAASGQAEPYGLIRIVSMLAWGLGYFGMPHILVRFMAIPHEDDEIKELADEMGVSFDKLKGKVESLHEFNPMLGTRGCRLDVLYPEIAEMQTEAIVSAAINVWKEDDLHITPEIMVPLVSEVNELRFVKKVIKAKADELIEQSGLKMKYMVGTMIETPRAAVTAGDVAKEAEFFSFGTNDLTQMTYGFSRDDVGRILETYFDKKILESDPFARLDQNGVGRLIRFAVAEGKRTRPDIKLGICGEHGGDLSSVEFCHNVGLNYVSCSPFRVPIARLAAAQARVKELGLA